MKPAPQSGSKYLVKIGDDYPATYVTWDGATDFCKRLTDFEHLQRRLPEGWKYALPAEAQWEYACRAGTQSRFSFGNDRSLLEEYGWCGGDTGVAKIHPESVGQRKPNPWGFYDMHGNVEEWCQDLYVRRNGSGVTGRRPDEHYRVFRGGDFTVSAEHCRSAARSYEKPEYGYWYLGFRVAAVPK